MKSSLLAILFLPLLAVLSGCPVMQPQDTPVPQTYHTSGVGRGYWLYVPSNYNAQRAWPMVVSLQGTNGWDSASAQVREWKALAEKKGFIVVAPELTSVHGFFGEIESIWRRQLEDDDKAILAVMDEVARQYTVDTRRVLLCGFSAGGFPLYYTGLSHPERFSMLFARSCNFNVKLMDKIEFTDVMRKLPITVLWGKDDLSLVTMVDRNAGIQQQSWYAIEYLSNHHCNVRHREVEGGHNRRPELTYDLWQQALSPNTKPKGD